MYIVPATNAQDGRKFARFVSASNRILITYAVTRGCEAAIIKTAAASTADGAARGFVDDATSASSTKAWTALCPGRVYCVTISMSGSSFLNRFTIDARR